MEMLDVLLGYENRQVILNVYREEELLKKDGFLFERIRVNPNRIEFIRESQTIEELMFDSSSQVVQLTGFPRHYAIEQDGLRTELYFP